MMMMNMEVLRRLVIPIFFLCLLNNLTGAVEESEPEVFLPPRNFNPHPYEIGYDPSGARGSPQQIYENQVDPYGYRNTGPILFPNNPQDSFPGRNPYPAHFGSGHPVDGHPYAGVAKKKKYRLGLGRFQTDEQVNPQVYKALAAHGAKVLRIPQAKDLKDAKYDSAYSNDKKDYAFSYKVVDHLNGDDFSHSQSQNSHATNGEYRVKLPDGRLQIVSYTADQNGYKADVKYTEEDVKYVEEEYRPQYEYQPERIRELPLYPPLDKHHHVINKPVYLQDVELILPNKYVIPRKVQLFRNIHEEKVGKFIGSTLAPFTVDGSKGLVSTLAPDLDKFNPIYIDTTAKYKLPLRQYKK